MTNPKKPATPSAVPPAFPEHTIADWLHNKPAAKAQAIADYHEARRIGMAGNAIPDGDKPYRVVLGNGAVWERR